jgi:Family of unknown function (DUF5681)
MARNTQGGGAGYRQPPKNMRFEKGRSGNPNGRPKTVSSFKADLAAELQGKLVLIEDGKQRRVSKQRAFAKTLIAAAIKKDIRAVNALLACMKFFGVGSDEAVVEATDVDDLDLLENYLAQQRKKEARQVDSASDGKKQSGKRK